MSSAKGLGEGAGRGRAKKKKPATKVRPQWSPAKHGLKSFFDDLELAGQQVRSWTDQAHVIDLLDAF
jgi:hypothetical protein